MIEELLKERDKSNCFRRKVGALIVNESSGWIVARGHNKIIDYVDSCKRCGCKRKNCISGEKLGECDAIHAEIVAIEDLRYYYSSDGYNDLVMYISTFPCHECAKAIISLGIKKLYYLESYPSMDRDMKMLLDNDIYVEQLEVIK